MLSSNAQVLTALAWTLIHSLWQGALAALAYAVARRASASPGVRYAVGHGCLGLFIVAQAVTYSYASSSTLGDLLVALSTSVRPVTAKGFAMLRLPADSVVADAVATLDPMLPWLGACWLAGLSAQAAWVSVMFVGLRLELRRCREVAEPYRAKLASLLSRLPGVRGVRFLESDAVSVPATVGWLRPVVLVPAGWLLGTAPRDVEAIVLHELSHVARRDFLGGLLRVLIGGVYYFNLPLRWQLRSLSDDAEEAADALAATAFGDHGAYGEALLRLERSRPALALALGAGGGTLARRIRNLLAAHGGIPRRLGRASAVAAAGLLSLCLLGHGVADAAANRGDLVWLERHTLTSGAIELLARDRPNAEAERLIAELRGVSALPQARLAALANSLRDGFGATTFVDEADAVPPDQAFAKASLPTFGTAADRAGLVAALRSLAERADGADGTNAARAAVLLASVNLSDAMGATACKLILESKLHAKLGLSAARSRRLELLVATHNRRVAAVFKRVNAVAPGERLAEGTMAEIATLLGRMPGAWRQVARVKNAAVKEQIIAAEDRRDDL